jgi:Cu(I)/Ag(I) efflux system membrane fusion protein
MWGALKPLTSWIVLILLAVAAGYWLRGNGNEAKGGFSSQTPANTESRKDDGGSSLYVCPMMCVPPQEKGGKCPVCGMDLLAVSGGSHGEEDWSHRLALSPGAARLSEIQTAPVERKFVSAEVRLFGQMEYDPSHMSYVSAFMPGVIDRVYVKRAGQFVRWGDPLFDIYSPDLYATERELLEVMKHVPPFLAFQAGRPHVAKEAPVQPRAAAEDPSKRTAEAENALKTIEAIRDKMRLLGLPKRDVDELMKKGEPSGIATVYAPMYGVVVEQNAYEGTYVNTGTRIFTLGDPQYVWARLDAYESDYPWIRKGQEAAIQTDAYPGESFRGSVVFIDPIIFNARSRTFRVGILLEDQGGRFKPGMLVRAVIDARLTATGRVASGTEAEGKAPLVIPATAPLITGKRAVVYVAAPDQEGVFEGREVVLGPRARDHYVVREGLREGERVVTRGNFKIDSAVQILAKASMMGLGAGRALEHQDHGGSEAMHQDYWSDRLKSRTKSLSEGQAGGAGPGASGGAGQMGSPEDRRSGGRETIHRRKPGAYGDTTRMNPAQQFR